MYDACEPERKTRWVAALKIRRLREEDVRHECLGIPIDHGEPGALHLDHDPMARAEDVIVGRKRRSGSAPPHWASAAPASRDRGDIARGGRLPRSSAGSRPSPDPRSYFSG